MTLAAQIIAHASFRFPTTKGIQDFAATLFVNGEGEWVVEIDPAVTAAALPWDLAEECIRDASGFWYNDSPVGVENRETFLLRVSNELRKVREIPMHPSTAAFPGSEPAG